MNETDRKEKPAELFEAIQYIDTVVNHLKELRDRIYGNSAQIAETKDTEPGSPPLSDLLEGGGKDIRKKCEEAHVLIEEITGILF